MAIAEGIAAIKATVDVAKILSDQLNRPGFDVAMVRAKLHEMLIHAVNAQTALTEAQLELFDLRRQLQDRNRIQELGSHLIFDEGVYWYRDYPYCPNCWDAQVKPTRLDGPYASSSQARSWICPIHKSKYFLRRMAPD